MSLIRDCGIVIVNEGVPRIAKSDGTATYNLRNETKKFEVGDSVTFTPINGGLQATGLEPRSIIVPVKFSGGELLLECQIKNIRWLPGNARHCCTNFIKSARVSTSLNHLTNNALINKSVYIKLSQGSFEVSAIRPCQTKSISVTGFVYQEKSNPSAARVFVPGYPEDFLLLKSQTFIPINRIDSCVEFSILTETSEVDASLPFRNAEDEPFNTRHGGLIELRCNKYGDKLETIYGDPIKDENREMEARDVRDFEKKNLWIRLKGENEKKPTFYLDKNQPNLPKRKYPYRSEHQLNRDHSSGSNLNIRTNHRQQGRGRIVPNNQATTSHRSNRIQQIPRQLNDNHIDDTQRHYNSFNQVPIPRMESLSSPVRRQPETTIQRPLLPPGMPYHRPEPFQHIPTNNAWGDFSSDSSSSESTNSSVLTRNNNVRPAPPRYSPIQYVHHQAVPMTAPHSVSHSVNQNIVDQELGGTIRNEMRNRRFVEHLAKYFPELLNKIDATLNKS